MAAEQTAEVYRKALALAGDTLTVIAEWFLANAGDEHLESLITPEFKEAILRFGEVADTIEEALRG